ncbi:MAG TPA: hypothetical protein ENO08_06440 [Candidatus Eisenbacteria bacterium]|uniref:V-type ATPase subunit n=1 Tax=Eiseniibacteriota bacterium TaxID=2212470 RepID=A0A7V2AVK5_UNCEI|nr:hypothetical protein [Candidatus Eisenbacteria bacterium]
MARDYTYIVARLRALEAEMPDAAWFQRLARSPVGGLVSMAREFFPGFEQAGSAAEFESGLEAERTGFMVFLAKLLGDGPEILFLLSEYDFDNLLHAWKAAKLGREPVLTGAGLVDPDSVRKAAAEGARDILPTHIGRLLEELERQIEKGDLASAQYAGEAMKYRFLLDAAPGEAARGHVRRRIDLSNMKTLIRLARSSLRGAGVERALLDGGSIERDRFAGLLGEPEEELYSFLEYSDYRSLLRMGLGREADLWKIDSVLSGFLLGALEESRLSFFDLSPVLYHIALRARNERAVRAVFAGRPNGLPEDLVLERVEAALAS